ncbi:MAG TPA: hypothetical protein VIL55_06760 [Naasia sp.]
MSGASASILSPTLVRADGRAVGRHVGGQHATDEGSAARDVLFELAHHRLVALLGAGWRLSPGEPSGAPLYDDLVSRAIAASIARALPDLPAAAGPIVLDSPLPAVPTGGEPRSTGAATATAPTPLSAATPDPPSVAARPWPSWASTPWSPPLDRNSVGPGGEA